MKNYELTVLVHPDLEMNTEAATSKIEKLVKENGGNIKKVSCDGKRKLAYTISGHDYAIYYYYELELPAQAPAKISSVLNITDEVIRYLLVAEDARKVKFEAKKALRRQNRVANEKEENAEEE